MENFNTNNQDNGFLSCPTFNRIFSSLENQFYFRHTRKGKFTYISPSIQKVLGYESISFISENQNFLTDHSINIIKKRKLQEQSNDEYDCYPVQVKHKNGQLIFLEIQEWPIFNKDKSEILEIEGIARDITTEKLKSDLNKELAKSNALYTVAAGIAHHFNNILTIIAGNVSLGKTFTSTDQLMKNLNNIERTVNRAARIVKSLTQYSHLQHFEKETNTINDIIDEAVASFKTFHEELEIHFNIDIKVREKEIICDKELVIESLLSLFNNSLEAYQTIEHDKKSIEINVFQNRKCDCPKNKSVYCSKYKNHNCLYIEVKDFATGIKEEDVSKIFEPFFTTKDMSSGSGLGLSACKGILETHGGDIEIKNGSDKGAIATICLPII